MSRVQIRAIDIVNASLIVLTAAAVVVQAVPPRRDPPTAPTNLTATAVSNSEVDLTWTPSTDNVGVTGYLIERCVGAGCSQFTQIGATVDAALNDTELSAFSTYRYRVRATDADGNLSGYSAIASATTLTVSDTLPPTAPASPAATAVSSNQIDLTWTSSTDDVGVAAYLIERCQNNGCTSFAEVESVSATSFSDSGLAPSTSYSYRVRATDAASNVSGYSTAASATTLSVTDTEPPTAPGSLSATAASGTEIDLSWSPSTGSVGITNYLVESCAGDGCTSFVQVGSPVTTSYANTGLTPSTSYSYHVRAVDAAGNLSAYSTAATTITRTITQTGAPITFRQVNDATPQTPQATVTVPFTSEQFAGDLNVVVVGWSDSSARVQSVTDTAGNIYQQAIGPTVQPGVASQTIFYAPNIAAAGANANTVRVVFSGAARYPDVRIAEYGGLDTVSPVNAVAAAEGSGGESSSGPLTTTSANALLVAANLVQTVTTQAGIDFTRRVITYPDSDILEDRIVTSAGSYTATAPVGGGAWIMQMVAFRATAGAAPVPTITSLSPASGSIGTPITIAGANFGATQGNSIVTFNGTVAAAISWSATTIVAPVPAGATSGNVAVTVGDVASNSASFIVTPARPTISGLNPSAGAPGTPVTISGANFGNTQGSSSVSFNGTAASPTNWSATAIVAPVPAGVTSGTVVVTVGGLPSNGANFTVTTSLPTITGLNPASGAVGTVVTVTGANFGASPGNGGVSFNGVAAFPTSWSTNTIVVPVPAEATTGSVVVTVDGQASNGVNFFVASATTVAYPLKASANGRYLVDQNNVPFLLVGDTAHALSGKMSEAEAAAYFANRQANHFNSVVIYAPCAGHVECNGDGTTFDGIAPFTVGDSPETYDLSTPNEVYFRHVDNLVNSAGNFGLNVFLDPIDTGDFLETLRHNGPDRAFSYGAYVGSRYRNFPNIIWLNGEDFQDWTNPSDNYLVAQVMAGIASVDSNHLQTIQLNYNRSYSNQDPDVTPYLTYDMAYTYYETYDYVLAAYNSSPTMPAFLGEAYYEGENNTLQLPEPATVGVLRRQEYWTLLSGGSGHLWGNHFINHVLPEWRDNLDTPGVNQIQHSTNLFNRYEWWSLVPDQNHEVVTDGYGSYTPDNLDLTTSDYVTTAWIPDGTLAIAYSPTVTSLAVDLSRFVRPIVAHWYDPSTGTFQPIEGSPFSNSGTQTFDTPGSNNDGDFDWVLVLDATLATLDTQAPSVPANLTATAGGSGQINLTWIGATDNVGVTTYLIDRCQGEGCGDFRQVGTSASTLYRDNRLSPLTSYTYRVHATDAAGNIGDYSNLASAITAAFTDAQPPTTPGNLTAMAASSSRIDLSWIASTDDVGVAGYAIERCQGAGCTSFTLVGTSTTPGFSNTGLAPSTSYSYRVLAADDAGNVSGYSNTATAATSGVEVAFIQANYATPQTLQSTVTVTFAGAQTAGNLNIVAVGWNDTTAQVQSITDSAGNIYVRAIGPTVQAGLATQSIYYAANINAAAPGANTLTVRFTAPARYADIRIAEYSGIDPVNPLDATAAAQGAGGTSSSGSLTTSGNALLVAANTVQTLTTGAGSGFTERVITSPDGDILEDRVVAGRGSYSATASVSPPDGWLMQIVAFRLASAGSNPP